MDVPFCLIRYMRNNGPALSRLFVLFGVVLVFRFQLWWRMSNYFQMFTKIQLIVLDERQPYVVNHCDGINVHYSVGRWNEFKVDELSEWPNHPVGLQGNNIYIYFN